MRLSSDKRSLGLCFRVKYGFHGNHLVGIVGLPSYLQMTAVVTVIAVQLRTSNCRSHHKEERGPMNMKVDTTEFNCN